MKISGKLINISSFCQKRISPSAIFSGVWIKAIVLPFKPAMSLGDCPRIDFYCDRLQILMPALSSPKRPQRRLLLRLRPFWPCRLAIKTFARSCYEAILGQPPRKYLVGFHSLLAPLQFFLNRYNDKRSVHRFL